MRMMMHQFGMSLGTRDTGRLAKSKIIEILDNTEEKIIFDFSHVSVVSNSFADEVFGKLILEYDFDEFKARTTFANINRFAAICIKKAIENRIKAVQV